VKKNIVLKQNVIHHLVNAYEW